MAELANETLESLALKLAEYQANLDGINAALAVEPESEDLAKLKSDLEEVIAYFRDLIILKQAERDQAAVEAAAGGGEAEAAVIPSAAAEPGGIAAAAESEGLDPAAFLAPGEDAAREAEATAQAAAAAVAAAAAAASVAPQPAPQALALIGRTCVMTKENQKLEFGSIQGLSQIDPVTSLPVTVLVYWFARGQPRPAPVQKLRLLSPMPPESIVPGMAAQALFSEDGQWYSCTIDAITQEGYAVTYTGYGNQETVPGDRLRPADSQVVGSGQSLQPAKKKTVKEIVTPGGYKIPANLLVKPTDTQVQRAEKRRRLNQLKKEQKAAAEETEARDRQTGWKSHLNRSMKKSGNRVATALLHDYAPEIIKDPAYAHRD